MNNDPTDFQIQGIIDTLSHDPMALQRWPSIDASKADPRSSIPPAVDRGSVLEPSQYRTVIDYAADRLITAIVVGEYPVNRQLPSERDMAALMGISRSSLRQALKRLIDLGYVEIRRGRNGGAFVKQVWMDGAADAVRHTLAEGTHRSAWVWDFLGIVEPIIARTAAERRRPENILALHQALQNYVATEGDHPLTALADEAFHHEIGQATQNPLLVGLAHHVVPFGTEALDKTGKAFQQAVAEHKALVDAISAGESDRAAAIAAVHHRIHESVIVELRGAANVAG